MRQGERIASCRADPNDSKACQTAAQTEAQRNRSGPRSLAVLARRWPVSVSARTADLWALLAAAGGRCCAPGSGPRSPACAARLTSTRCSATSCWAWSPAAMLWSLYLLVRSLPKHTLPPAISAALRGRALGHQRPGVRFVVLAARCRRTACPPSQRLPHQGRFPLSADDAAPRARRNLSTLTGLPALWTISSWPSIPAPPSRPPIRRCSRAGPKWP